MNGQLNTEGRQILEKFERGKLHRAAGAEAETVAPREAARTRFNKTRWVNL